MQVNEDEKEKAEAIRDQIEYLARFWNNDAVEKVKKAREHRKITDESDFEKMVQSMFGRPFSNRKKKTTEDLKQDLSTANDQLDQVRVIKKPLSPFLSPNDKARMQGSTISQQHKNTRQLIREQNIVKSNIAHKKDRK